MKKFMSGKWNLILSFILLVLISSCRIIQNRESKKEIIVTAQHQHKIKYFKEKNNFEDVPVNKYAAQKINVFDIFKTKEYKVYNELKDQAGILNGSAVYNFISADELKMKALERSAEAQMLTDTSDHVQDKTQRNELLKRAEMLDKEFIKLIAESDSIRELARNSDAAWFSRRIEAELYLQSVDPKRYDQIIALYSIFDPQKIRTTAMNGGR